jgi:hypothetical protein
MSGTTWETVYSEQFDVMHRMRLDDGWIYRNRLVMSSSAQNPADYHWQVTSTYVPDVVAAPLVERPQQRPEQQGESRTNPVRQEPGERTWEEAERGAAQQQPYELGTPYP